MVNVKRNGKEKEYWNGKLEFECEYWNDERKEEGKEYDISDEVLILELW